MKVVKTIRSWNLPLEDLLTQNKNTKTKGKKMETIDDIVRDMRIGDIRATANTSSAVERKAFEYINDFLAGYADRIEEALTNCNQLKIREALEEVVKVGYPHNFQREAPHIRGYCYEITAAIEKCFAALAEPPRNCDIGTAEEQGERCLAQFEQWKRKGEGKKLIVAIMEWSQMPYGEAKNEA